MPSLRTIVRVGWLVLILLASPWRVCAEPPCPRLEGCPAAVTHSQVLRYAASYAEPNFDRSSGMLRDELGRLDVRDTAISAFIWAEKGQFRRGVRAIEAVLNAQSLTPGSPSYGNFSSRPGEVPTNGTWSAFIGAFVLVFLDRYEDRLDADLVQRMQHSVRAAAAHRIAVEPGLHGTNTAILSAFVLIRAGERSNDAALLAAGHDLWERWVAETDRGGIAEYNSPDYAKVDVYGLGFIADYVRDKTVQATAERMRRLFWWSLTRHYHSPTRQLAGPWSRTYTDRMMYEPTGVQALLARESNLRVPVAYAYRQTDPSKGLRATAALQAVLTLLVKPSWPKPWVSDVLTPIGAPLMFRERVKFFFPGAEQQISTVMTPTLAMGSVNREFFRQNSEDRPVIAHAVAPGVGGDVGVFKVTGEFASTVSMISSVQNGRSLLSAISLGSVGTTAAQATLRVEFIGTDASPTLLESASVGWNVPIRVLWMGRYVVIRMIHGLMPPDSTIELRHCGSGRDLTLEVFARVAAFPNQAIPVYPAVLAIHVGEAYEVPNDANSITWQAADVVSASWASPDGVLEMLFPNRKSELRIFQAVNGEPIPSVPLVPEAIHAAPDENSTPARR